MDKIVEKTESDLKSTFEITREMSEKIFVIPPQEHVIYLKFLKIIVNMMKQL